MRIIYARHGETTGDVEDRYGGDYDDHLTKRGHAQSEELAQKLKDRGIERILVSPRIRACETARHIADQLELDIEIIEDLRERNRYGILSGLTKAEAAAKHPEQVALLNSRSTTLESGESMEDFAQRIDNILDEITQYDADTVLIVSHGGPLHYLFEDVFKEGKIHPSDCSFAVIETSENGFQVTELEGIEKVA